ncbi:MAG: CFI-box-CTERM domain-containing protein [Nitrososphaera sp.]
MTLIFLAIIVLSGLHHAAYAEEPFSFHNQSSFVDETNIIHVLGEVKNESNSTMREVVVKASFYDATGNLLDEYQRTAELRMINPGESSPFEVLYLNQQTADRVADFKLSATGQPAPEVKEKQLKILSSTSRLDVLGTYYINVLARNEGQEDATNAIVIATLYDQNNKVIAIGKALAEAVRGSSEIPAGSEAAFGIAITERLQTQKAARYSLVADSDQYSSDVIVFKATGPGITSSSGGNQTQTSGCLIATAAFGSDLSPQVQQLRGFRDGIAMQTFAGRSFMSLFNAWYYSFSPSVAEFERGSPWLQDAVRFSVYPLLEVLDMSTGVYDVLSHKSDSSEFAIVATGIAASFLIGMLYLAPAAALAAILRRGFNSLSLGIPVACSWISSLTAISIAAPTHQPELMMFGSGLLVLTCISTAFILTAGVVSRLRIVLFSRN